MFIYLSIYFDFVIEMFPAFFLDSVQLGWELKQHALCGYLVTIEFNITCVCTLLIRQQYIVVMADVQHVHYRLPR